MIRPFLKNVFPRIAVFAGVIALCGAMAQAQNSTPAPGQRSDGQIEMDVVHALDASSALKKDLITAATIQSEVTLSGTVASDASKELAESIAGHVAGVTAVHNNLKVGNPQEAQNAQPADAGDPSAQQMAEGQQPGSDEGPTPPPQAYPQAPPQANPPAPPQSQAPNYPYPPPRAQYPAPPPRYSQMQPPPEPAYETPKGPVTIPVGTLLQVRTSEPVGTKRAKEGTPVQFTVIQDVAFGGVLAIPRGAVVHGVVTETKRSASGDLGGSSELSLKLTSLDLGGQNYNLETDQFKVKGPSKTGRTVNSAIGGGILGTIIGCAAGRGVGCAIGAGAGAAAGTAASAAAPGADVWIPAEAQVDFHLAAPVTVQPVSAQEAARLSQGLYPGGPSLYRRGYYRPGPYGPVYYAYPYPPVYYRPYYMVGGYYYWR